MAIHSVKSFPLFALLIISLFPLVHSLSTVAISETGNQTLVCAITHSVRHNQTSISSVLNCTGFPQRIQIPLNSPLNSISGVVGGNGFICALTSFYSSSTSVIVCWRFSDNFTNMTYTRIYKGPILTDLASGNSSICSLINGSSSLQCWPYKDSNFTNAYNTFSSSLAAGENFLCGLSESGQVQCLGSDRNVTDFVPMGRFGHVKAGFRHACAISINGSLECWGSNMKGEMPKGEFTSLALGENRSCAIRRNNGTVICWGEIGFDLPDSLKNESFISIEAKRRVFCGVETSKMMLFCWGNEVFDSNPKVFDNVVPGSCITKEKCACGPLPHSGEYCDEGLIICQHCLPHSSSLPPPPPPLLPQSQPPEPPSSTAISGGKKWSTKMVAFVVVGSVGSFSLLLASSIFLFSRYFKIGGSRIHDSGRLEEGGPDPPRRSSRASPPQQIPPLEKKLSHLISMQTGGHLEEFPLQALLKATENFSHENKIGTGSFGSVYRATLDDGRQVAVKRAEKSSTSSYVAPTNEKDLAFLNELEFLSKLNHKNLVRLLGYCEDSNELVLVYEYLENGTLFDHLHKNDNNNDSTLSWPMRIKLALDAARGIEYLHQYAVPRVIHRDIKSSNILIDATWTARVADFGLSLRGPQDDEGHLALGGAGTMGYMDPEYYRLQILTTKSDVYSFGIVLLELLSGFGAIHKNENGVPRNVVDYVVPYIVKDEIHRVLDRGPPPPTPFEIEAVAYVGYLAADCVCLEGKNRPSMSEVVDSLDRALGACLAPTVVLSRSTTASSAEL